MNQSISPTLNTQQSLDELSWERNAATTDQSPTTLPEDSAWPSFPSVPATMDSVSGGPVCVSLTHSQISITEDMGLQDAQYQEPYVIQNGILPQSQSIWSTSMPTGGRPCSSPVTVHSTTMADPQNESTTNIPLRLTFGPEPWRMGNGGWTIYRIHYSP